MRKSTFKIVGLTSLLGVWAVSALTISESVGFGEPHLAVDPKYGSVVTQCRSGAGKKQVWIFKQWHLAPSVNTKNAAKSRPIPQEKNQTAIYRLLNQWVENHLIHEIYAEGCSGELTDASSLSFNGWTLRDLKEKATESTYAEIVSHVPAKLEARFGDKLRTVCGDDEALIKSNNLAFSDARGALGFLTRISEYMNDSTRVKTYLEGVVELYHLPKKTTPKQAIARLKVELKSSVERIRGAIEKRNAVLVNIIRSSSEPRVAVVFGGVHIAGVVKLLESYGIGCSVVNPVGYEDNESKLLEQLEESLKRLK